MRGFSLVAALAALLIVATGQTDAISNFFKPGGGAETAVRSETQGAISKAESANVRVDMQTLIQSSLFEIVGVDQIQKQTIFNAVKASEPAIPLGAPLDQGGITLAVANNDAIIYCAKPEVSFLCMGINPVTRDQQEATAFTMSAAIKKVSDGLR